MDADYALVGGGLQNGLIALALEAVQPAARIVMIERGDAPGGNHTWCFHAGDLAALARTEVALARTEVALARTEVALARTEVALARTEVALARTEVALARHQPRANAAVDARPDVPSWIERLIVARWDGYEVAFPAYSRTLASPYACVSSERFAHEVTRSLAREGCRLITRANAIEVEAHRVVVKHADGRREEIRAHAVIDARGPDAARSRAATRAHVGALDSAEVASGDPRRATHVHVGALDSAEAASSDGFDPRRATRAHVGALDSAELASGDPRRATRAHVGALDSAGGASSDGLDTRRATHAHVGALDSAEVASGDPRASRRTIAERGKGVGPHFSAASAHVESGWQKFVGQELRLDGPHGLERPVLMDATVPQIDGFRFIYILPLAEDRVLVEDTYFSDGTHIDVAELRARIAAYIARRGWRVAEVVREEVGLLPLPLRAEAPSPSAPLVAGYAGGWFHPVTGYSFPIAARLASLIASMPAKQLFGDELRAMANAQATQMRFALRLNRMLFRWFPPAQRFRVLERFYRLPEALVRRFYALELTALDRLRILVGRPPRGMSIRAALGFAPSDPALPSMTTEAT